MNSFRELRKERKLTQIELSKLLGIDQTTVSKWELGKALPDTATLIKLADFFDVSTDYLLSRSNFYYPDKLIQSMQTVAPMGDSSYSSEEREIILKYRTLPEKLKKMFRYNLEVYSESNELLPKKDKKV